MELPQKQKLGLQILKDEMNNIQSPLINLSILIIAFHTMKFIHTTIKADTPEVMMFGISLILTTQLFFLLKQLEKAYAQSLVFLISGILLWKPLIYVGWLTAMAMTGYALWVKHQKKLASN